MPIKRLTALILFLLFASSAFGASAPSGELYTGWLKMYDLKFDEAHSVFAAWMREHPADPMGPVSNAAAFLFSELARLGILEAEFFTDNTPIRERDKLRSDPAKKAAFLAEIDKAVHLADAALQRNPADQNALFAKSLTFGLRADNSGLIEKQQLTALGYTKEGRIYSDELMHVNPGAFDAYLGPGLENYLLSLKAAPIRFILRMTGSNVDREKGIEEIRRTANQGYYLEPFARLLLAVAALRDNNRPAARQYLGELHRRFPDNELYTRELDRIR